MGENNFSCTGWGFPPKFSKNGDDVGLVSDENDIRESLEILFSTAINERLNYPDFGCDLKKFVFEEVNDSLVIEIEDMILEAVSSYEPRIEIQSLEIAESEDESNLLLINLNYLIIETKILQDLVYPFYLY